MFTRRIVISACALCIAVPSAASASPATDPPTPVGHHGVTATAYPKLVKAKGPYGTTPATHPKLVKAKGPYGTTTATYPNLVEAEGPYGTTVATSTQRTTGATAHPASASSSDDINDWRTAAISEAALLAALALGSVWLLSTRRHGPRLGI